VAPVVSADAAARIIALGSLLQISDTFTIDDAKVLLLNQLQSVTSGISILW